MEILAISYYQSGLKSAALIGLTEEKAFLYNNMGEAYLLLNNTRDASTYFQKAISLGVDNKFGRILWEAYFGIGQCAEKENNGQAAISYYNKSIELIDKIRSRIFIDTFKAGFARDKLKVYERILNLLFKAYEENPSASRIEELFSVVEKAKARAFLETLGDARIDLRQDLSPGLKKREEDVSREISAALFELSKPALGPDERDGLFLKLGRAEDEYVRLISEMRTERPELANLVSPELCSLRQIQESILDDKTGLVEYYLGETRSFMFFATKKEMHLYPLPAKSVIEASLKGYLKILHSSPRGNFLGNKAAERIAGEILFPLKLPSSQSIDKLIIVPDGVFYYLPFEALRLSDDKDPFVQYLVERYTVSYAPSSSSLLFLTQKESGPRSKRLLAFGNPVYQREGSGPGMGQQTAGEILREFYLNQGFYFSPLPYSKKEIRDISRHFPAGEVDIFLGGKAKEETLKSMPLAEYRIVHFACHGLLDEQVPFRSALVLSIDEDKGEDGFLQVREIYNLRLNADMVVLSACQTGRGRLESGEGLLGLPRIFFYAGAKSVISTLWPINDKSTSILMRSLYEHLSKGESKSQAIRSAKIKMLNSKYAHPFYWAAFVLNGDSGPPAVE
ncbi:MAG: CHAT domain-containing protein [Candidatus Aminicenantales bacterium]